MRKTLYAVAAAGAALALAAGPAFAQAAVVVATKSPWQEFMDQVWAGILPTISVIVTGLLTLIALWVREKFKFSVSEDIQQTLHRAIMSGILFGLQRIGYSKMPEGATLTEEQRKIVVATALDYTKASVPGAVRDSNATDEKITKMAAGKVEGIESGLIVPDLPGSAPPPAAPPAQ